MFYGIIIRMYYAPSKHPPPHFHVYYGEFRATVDIRTCEMMGGKLPTKQQKLVLAWGRTTSGRTYGRLGSAYEW